MSLSQRYESDNAMTWPLVPAMPGMMAWVLRDNDGTVIIEKAHTVAWRVPCHRHADKPPTPIPVPSIRVGQYDFIALLAPDEDGYDLYDPAMRHRRVADLEVAKAAVLHWNPLKTS